MSVCQITDEEFIRLINAISVKEMAGVSSFFGVSSVDDKLLDSGIDSLSVMMLFVWLSEGFGMSEEDSKDALTGEEVITVQRIIDFVKQYQTRGYTFDEVREIFGKEGFNLDEES